MPNDKGLKAIPIHMVHNLQQLPVMFEILKPRTKDRDPRAKDSSDFHNNISPFLCINHLLSYQSPNFPPKYIYAGLTSYRTTSYQGETRY